MKKGNKDSRISTMFIQHYMFKLLMQHHEMLCDDMSESSDQEFRFTENNAANTGDGSASWNSPNNRLRITMPRYFEKAYIDSIPFRDQKDSQWAANADVARPVAMQESAVLPAALQRVDQKC